MYDHRKALFLTGEELHLLEGVLDLHLQGLEHVNPAVCEDPSIPDWETLLEVTADTDRELDVLTKLKERINEHNTG